MTEDEGYEEFDSSPITMGTLTMGIPKTQAWKPSMKEKRKNSHRNTSYFVQQTIPLCC